MVQPKPRLSRLGPSGRVPSVALPLDDENRRWIEEELGRLVARRGPGLLVSAPILLPDDRAFPDRYRSPLGAVRITAERLLWYAGLDRRVLIEIIDDRVQRESLLPLWDLEVRGVRPNRLILELRDVGRAATLPGILSHQVALAVRAALGLDQATESPYRGSSHADEETEAMLASLTTIYLGWGVLATNAAETFASAGEQHGRWSRHAWSHEHAGALHFAELAYALALQLAARRHFRPEDSQEEAKRVIAALSPNQAQHVRRWLGELEGAWVVERLGLPAEAPTWVTREIVAREDTHSDTERGINEGRPVFRVEKNAAGAMTPALGLGGLIGGLIAGLGAMPLVLTTAVGAAVGYVVGKGQSADVCSDPRCETQIPTDAESCPGCGGIIAGRIASPADRLEAEEDLPREWWLAHDLEPPAALSELAESTASPEPEID